MAVSGKKFRQNNEEPMVSNCACYIHKYYNSDISVIKTHGRVSAAKKAK